MLAKTSTILCVIGALASTARAQPEDAEPHAEAPADGVDQLTLPKGRVLLDAFLEMNLSTDFAFKPVSLSPDIWYGVTDDITAGLIHSGVGRSGFIGGVGDSLCLTGTENGCSDVYNEVGVEARYKLKFGQMAWAVNGGLFIRQFDPFQLALKVGVVGRWHSGPLAVELSPNIFFGLTNRTSSGTVIVASNEEVLDLPVTGLYSVTPVIAVAVQTGVMLPFQNTGDTYAIPLSIGAHYRVNESASANLAFSLPILVGGGPLTGFDARSLTLGGAYAF
jgi:hypothetical protein